LSKDRLLLRQIGVFFHGEEWQAPLARDLRVSERTIRRWVAGTEEIPRGVWRDLSAHLEIYDRTLGSLVAHVKDAAGLTQAHPLGIGDSKLKITRVALPKEKLQKLTTGERSLFLLLGYASNQINTLWKLVVVTTNEGEKDPVEEKVSAAQTQIFVRLLIGIMREALKLIEKRFWEARLERNTHLASARSPQKRSTVSKSGLARRTNSWSSATILRFIIRHWTIWRLHFNWPSNRMETTRIGVCT
jgi:hypothetical protein